jgi:hypothetical protein
MTDVMSCKMQGQLAQYAVLNKDGSEIRRVVYDKPPKNQITNLGIDRYCGFPISQVSSEQNFWLGTATGQFASLLHWCGRGTSTTPTDPTMTNLVAQVGNYTNQLATSANLVGTWYTRGSTNIADSPWVDTTITLRVSHLHEAEPADVIINEIGMFADAGGANHCMFSRIVLPVPISLEEGQVLQTTYDLIITIPNTAVTTFSDTGILNWTSPGSVRLATDFPANSTAFVSTANGLISVINTSGATVSPTTTNTHCNGLLMPHIFKNGATMLRGGFSTSTTATFPTLWANESTSLTYWVGNTPSSGISSLSKLPYTAGSRQVIRQFSMMTNWGSTSTFNVKYFNLLGMGRVLDNVLAKLPNFALTINSIVQFQI